MKCKHAARNLLFFNTVVKNKYDIYIQWINVFCYGSPDITDLRKKLKKRWVKYCKRSCLSPKITFYGNFFITLIPFLWEYLFQWKHNGVWGLTQFFFFSSFYSNPDGTREQKPMEPEEKIWEILLSADKKDYERICVEHGITDFRRMLKKLNAMKKEREEEIAEVCGLIILL